MKWFVILLLFVQSVSADTLSEVLSLLHQNTAAKFQYQEIRHLELMTTPWQAQGELYNDANGRLIKLQLQPNRIVMAIADGQMLYWEPAQNQRHTMPLTYEHEATQQIRLFHALLQGHTEELSKDYTFHAEKNAKTWALQLRPKQDDLPKLDISGNADNSQRDMVIHQDSESTEYHIQRVTNDSALDKTVADLLHEAAGE